MFTRRYAWAISPTLRTLVQLIVYGWFIIYDVLASSSNVSHILGSGFRIDLRGTLS